MKKVCGGVEGPRLTPVWVGLGQGLDDPCSCRKASATATAKQTKAKEEADSLQE
jgi:hypothetical protein